jgi:hypothetical protein
MFSQHREHWQERLQLKKLSVIDERKSKLKQNVYRLILAAVLALGMNAFAGEKEWKPRGLPPLVLTVSAEDASSNSSKPSWTLSIINVQKNIWDAATRQMPDVAWPHVEWAKPTSTFASSLGTVRFSVGDASSPDLVRVVDLNGNRVDREKVLKKLKEQKRVLVSFSGKLPDRAYRQYLRAQSDLVVILGGKQAAISGDPVPNDSKPVTRIRNEVDLSEVTDKDSREYGQKLADLAKETPKPKTVAKFREFAEGIWWVDRLAHAHRGNYLVSRNGEDAFLIFTDTWLVTGMFNSNEGAISYVISPLKEIKKDPITPGGFDVGGDFVGYFEPVGKTHLAWVAYDWWVIYERAK